MLVDWHYYGRVVVPALNTVVYNVFSAEGPTLFGVEPWHYYVLNLLLNLNIWFLFAVAAPLLACRAKRPILLTALTLVASLALFSSQAHKEERFMYHLYPLVALCAAYVLQMLPFQHLILVAGALVGASRHAAVVTNYGAPEAVFRAASKTIQDGTICLADSWYRAPPSFLLGNNARYGFVRSGYGGILPTPYGESSRTIRSGVNSANRPIDGQFVDGKDCDYYAGTAVEISKDLGTGQAALVCGDMIDVQTTRAVRRWVWLPLARVRGVGFCIWKGNGSGRGRDS